MIYEDRFFIAIVLTVTMQILLGLQCLVTGFQIKCHVKSLSGFYILIVTWALAALFWTTAYFNVTREKGIYISIGLLMFTLILERLWVFWFHVVAAPRFAKLSQIDRAIETSALSTDEAMKAINRASLEKETSNHE